MIVSGLKRIHGLIIGLWCDHKSSWSDHESSWSVHESSWSWEFMVWSRELMVGYALITTHNLITIGYGSQAWSFNDKNIKYIITVWNRAVRKIWNLPYDSHRILISALNNGSNALGFIYRRFCKMYSCMTNSENTKLSMFIKMCKNDKRMILSKNLRCVCKNCGVPELQLWSKWKSEKMSVFSKDNIE